MIWEITDRGFLPKIDPVPFLPFVDYKYAGLIHSLENLASMLPIYMKERRFREEAVYALRQSSGYYDDWTRHDIGKPKDFKGPLGYPLEGEDKELERAFQIYTYLASAYVHATGETTHIRVPKEIAIPLYFLADKMKRQPILSYASYCLYNWRRKDQAGPITVDNIELIQNFTCDEYKQHEDWFILIHVDIEAKAGPAIRAIFHDLPGILKHDLATEAGELLDTLHASLAGMNHTLNRMPEQCSPEVYHSHVRPYIFGFKNVVFESVEGDRPWTLRGETGAQSSIIPAVCAALGISHKNSMLTEHLVEMRKYMPPIHRDALASLETMCFGENSNLRSLAAKYPVLQTVYNACVDQVAAFRLKHLQYAVDYIQKKTANPEGTGGTPYVPWLSQLADETSAHKF